MDTGFFDRFMPHGQCYLWKPGILWTHVAADSLITLAYYSIPVAIVYFIRRRNDLLLPGVGWMFAAFIVLCGSTHAFQIWTIWHGDYGLSAILKMTTAVVSVATAVALWILMPRAVSIPSHALMNTRVKSATRKLKNTNKELESFVSVASHELKEPLRTLRVYSELLPEDLGDALPDNARRDVQYIQEAATRMQSLIDSLLDLAKIGRSGFRMEPVALDEVVSDVLFSLDGLVQAKGARVVVNDLPVLMADRSLLEQIYQNLIANALRYAGHSGPPEVTLTARPRSDGKYILGVTDNGPGIPFKQRKRAFQPFERLQPQPEWDGSGIGLAICERAVARLGGEIWIEELDNGGMHFLFTAGVETSRVAVEDRKVEVASAARLAY